MIHSFRRLKPGDDFTIPANQGFREIPLDIAVVFIILVHFLDDVFQHKSHRVHIEAGKGGVGRKVLKQRTGVFTQYLDFGKLRKRNPKAPGAEEVDFLIAAGACSANWLQGKFRISNNSAFAISSATFFCDFACRKIRD